jgi:hypothetical protein
MTSTNALDWLWYTTQLKHTGVFVLFGEKLGDLVSSLTIWELDIILGITSIVHKRKEAVFRNIELKPIVRPPMTARCSGSSYQLIFLSSNIWNFHIMGRWRQIFEFLAGEDVKSSKMDLCVTVLSCLGSRHVDDLAGTTFDDNVTVLSQGRALHGISRRRTSVGAFEGVLMLHKETVSNSEVSESAHIGRLMRGKLNVSHLRVVRHLAGVIWKVKKK